MSPQKVVDEVVAPQHPDSAAALRQCVIGLNGNFALNPNRTQKRKQGNFQSRQGYIRSACNRGASHFFISLLQELTASSKAGPGPRAFFWTLTSLGFHPLICCYTTEGSIRLCILQESQMSLL